MKSPLWVRASEGKKYCAPSGLPTSFHLRGSWAWSTSITPANTAATTAQRAPIFHWIFLPASRWITKSQAQATGARTWIQKAVDRRVGSLTTMTPSMRVRTIPLAIRASAQA